MKTFKLLLLFSFLLTILTLQTKCAKTDDVEPIVSNSNSNNDSTNNDSTSVTIADDTVYINSTISGFVLNEVLYDPSNNGLQGDANNDGVYVQDEDEFIEFVNNTDSCINISKCMIYDTENWDVNSPNHQFPDSVFINPNQAVVVFGGGEPTGSFGNALVFKSSNAVMNLNNSGDIMTFTDSSKNILIEFDTEPYSNNPNESYTRYPDLTGPFVQHNDSSVTLFSPGTRTDGTQF